MLQQKPLVFVVLATILVVENCHAITSTKRQATGESQAILGFPAEDLLPPPALSASFPTLRPRPARPAPARGNPPVPAQGNPLPPPRGNLPPPIRGNPPPPIRGNPPPPTRGNPPPPARVNPPAPSRVNPPALDLLPPARPANAREPLNSAPPAPPPTTSTEFPLLPPIEIPPERPIEDNEASQASFKQTSFIPTTGRGTGADEGDDFTLGALQSPSVANPFSTSNAALNQNAPFSSSQSADQPQQPIQNESPSSNVRFPDSDSTTTQVTRNCPSCECTSEVDYICASNGVVYLNSCSFDCATFCHEGLTKVGLEFCSSQNQK